MLLLLAAASAHEGPESTHGPGFPWMFFRKFRPPAPLSVDPDDLGGHVVSKTTDWVIAPDPQPSRIAFTYTADGTGIVEGGGLKVLLGHVLPTAQQIYTPFSLTVTSAYFFKINLLDDVKATCSDPTVKLRVREPRPGRSFGDILSYVRYKRSSEGEQKDGLLRAIDNEFAVVVEVVKGKLDGGESIDVTFGARKGLAPPKSEASWQIVTRVDGDGDGTFGLISDAPSFDAYSHQTEKVVAVAPSGLNPGETSRMVLRTEDGYFLPNLTRFTTGSVKLEPTDGLVYPTEATFTGGLDDWAGSLLELPVTAEREGVFRIRGTATIDGVDHPFLSNPIAVVPPGQPKVYFGDLHLHSILSYDADRPPEYVYWRQRAQERHDFAALSDHDMIGAVPFSSRAGVNGRTPDEWSYAKQLGNSFDEPGVFTTILAYEWTSYYFGHRNIFFSADEVDPPLYHHNESVDHPPFDELSPGELRDKLDGHAYIAIPHSPAWPTKNGRYAWGPGAKGNAIGDPTLWPEQRLLELYSTHGTSEYFDNEYAVDKGHEETPLKSKLLKQLLSYDIRQAEPDSGNFAQDALATGWRFGFVGSSDDHYLSHLDQAYKYGTAAVFAPALSRRDIWDGMHDRHTYAVTGVRILLEFSANDQPMGSFVAPGPLHLTGTVHGVGALQRVEVVKYDGQAWSLVYGADVTGSLDHTIAVDDPGSDGALYYLRVRQADGNRAWSSPIWVTNTPSDGS
jgi:hypothetical protein